METAMFADTSDNSQYSTHVTPKAEVANWNPATKTQEYNY
jgi:hypothetical protein